MKNAWEDHNPKWLIGLIRTQHPAEREIVIALKNCTRWRRDDEGYFFFLGVNETGASGDHLMVSRCIELRSEDEGQLILDVLADGRLLGIQFLDRQGEHVHQGLSGQGPIESLGDRPLKIRHRPPNGDVTCKGIINDSGTGRLLILCGQCRAEILRLEREPGTVNHVEKWAKCQLCRAWSSFSQPDYGQPTGKYTRTVPSDWTYSHNKPNFRGTRSSRSSWRHKP